MKTNSTTGKARILIVDDNEIDRNVATVMLKKQFEVNAVSNTAGALKALAIKAYDIILLDIDLGPDELNGIEVMKRIRENRRHRKALIFAVTAYDEQRDWFMAMGFDDLYTKPVIKEEMLEVMLRRRTSAISMPSGKLSISNLFGIATRPRKLFVPGPLSTSLKMSA